MYFRYFITVFAVLPGLILSAVPLRAQTESVQITPMLRYITVDGDEDKFREDNWSDDGWAGGIEDFDVLYSLDEDTSMEARGHAIFGENDYGFRLDITRDGLGSIRAGYTEYRKYYDDTGGFFAPFSPAVIDLGRDPELDIGRIFMEAELEISGWPKIGFGYEHQFRDGEKSLLNWGGVTQDDTIRNIIPAYEEIDQTVDIWTARIAHSFDRLRVEDNFRYEHYSRESIRYEEERNLTDGAAEEVTVSRKGTHDALFNTFFTETHIRESVYFSFGYLYSNLDGGADFNMQTVPFGEPFDKNWSAGMIDIDRNSHVVNLNAMAGPYNSFTFYGGLQSELTDTEGDTVAVLEEVGFTGEEEAPVADIRTREDLEGIQETAGVRYTGFSRTTLYAEGEFRQQNIDLDELELEDEALGFERITDTTVNRERYTFGFNTSPISRTTFTALYRKSFRKNDYDHDLNTVEDGYSAFITDQEFATDELSARISWRPAGWVKTMVEYKYLDTDIDTRSDTDPQAEVSSGNYNADVYSISFLFTPVSRFYVSSLFSFRNVRSRAFDNDAASVITYDGDSFTSVNSLNFIFDEQTEIRVEYSFSRTDNFQNNSASGLPLLQDYRRQRLVTTLSRKITDRIEAKVRYGFFDYQEDTRGGVDEYSGHLVGIAWEFKL